MNCIELTGKEILEAFERATGEKLTDVEFSYSVEKNEVLSAKLIIDRSNIKKENNERNK